MTKQEVKERLEVIQNKLASDYEFLVWRNLHKTVYDDEICNWIKENRPEVVNLCGCLKLSDVEDFGFLPASLVLGNLFI